MIKSSLAISSSQAGRSQIDWVIDLVIASSSALLNQISWQIASVAVMEVEGNLFPLNLFDSTLFINS